MNKAIVFGGNGNLGFAIVKTLLSHNIETLSMARHTDKVDTIKNNLFKNIVVDANDLHMLDGNNLLVNFVKNSDCVFYYTAWKGHDRLRDGSLQEQMQNVTYVSDAIILASKLGCSKFVYAGTQDEAIFEYYLNNNIWKEKACPEHDVNYMSAKLACRDMNLLISYLNKIDYIHTRFSAVINSDLSGVGFIPNTLKKILQKEQYPDVVNQNPMEIISIEELAEAYYHIGLHGKNKANYYLGRGEVDCISNFFKRFEANVNNTTCDEDLKQNNFPISLLDTFNSNSLFNDTNFKFNKSFADISMEIINK